MRDPGSQRQVSEPPVPELSEAPPLSFVPELSEASPLFRFLGRIGLLRLLFLLFPLLCTSLAARIVINEVLYDPVGADSGYEWIELYNAGENSVNLDGARIESAGSSFVSVFTLPSYVLRPGRYLLIGEYNVPEATFQTHLAFQNGGTATDAIRYVSPDGSYTDTVLYDEPNLNNLPDDTGYIATSFAPDVPAGYSLARRINGYDTDACAQDFEACPSPSPGLPNPQAYDYAISSYQLSADASLLQVWLRNLSLTAPDYYGELLLYRDGILQDSRDVAPLVPTDSLLVTFELPTLQEGFLLRCELLLEGDPNTGNNVLEISIGGGAISLLLNEIMYYPDSGEPEWIELYKAYPGGKRSNYRIRDLAGNSAIFKLPPQAGYYVVVSDSASFALAHPLCPPTSIIKSSGWAALNDSGDSISLYEETDYEQLLIDTYSYSGGSTRRGFSLERDEASGIWRESLSPGGSSPGAANLSPSVDVPQIEGRLAILGSPFKPRTGESLQVVFNLASEVNKVNCFIYDQAGRRRRILAANSSHGSTGALLWDGRDDSGRYLPAGLYFLLWESRAGSGGKIFRRQNTVILSL